MKIPLPVLQAENLESIIAYSGKSLLTLSQESPVLLVFLRHFGCIFCKKALKELSQRKDLLTDSGVQLVFVHMSDDETALKYLKENNLEGYDFISDPECAQYQNFGLIKGSFNQLFGLQVMLKGFKAAVVNGIPVSLKQVGDGLQMPGVFLINQGRIHDSFVHNRISDTPDYDELISCCAQ